MRDSVKDIEANVSHSIKDESLQGLFMGQNIDLCFYWFLP